MKRVFVGLSGGVDSSVTAALLQQQGYDVTGVYMKNWTQDLPGVKCPWQDDLRDARSVAAHLGIPFKVYDFQEEYRDKVVNYMIAEYQAGRTPNPDVMCNQEIKFKLFLDAALADGADMIATGHYATSMDGKLLRGVDDNKDQTYFLYRVTGTALVSAILPIGAYSKPEVRKLAAEFGLPTAAKKDSQGVCFIGPVGMKAFLQQYVVAEAGPMVLRGKEIGRHDGAIFYTIGQRSGLGVGGGKPYYVTGKDMAQNLVYVTDDQTDLQLQTDRVQLEDVHWINRPAEGSRKYQVRFRHRGELFDVAIVPDSDREITAIDLILDKPAHAIAPGQSAVIYDGQEVLGGGIIRAKVPAHA